MSVRAGRAGRRTNLLSYLEEQQSSASHVPTDRTIVVERTRDELGDWRLVVLSPFGARVHAPWALVAPSATGANGSASTRRAAQRRRPRGPAAGPARRRLAVRGDGMPVPRSRRDRGRRHAAGRRFGTVRRAFPGVRRREPCCCPARDPGGGHHCGSSGSVRRSCCRSPPQHPTFPIVLEAVRECLQDVYDLPALVELMTPGRNGEVRVSRSRRRQPSPFARSLLFGYVAEYLYEGDSPLAERRAAALTLDPTLLGELLGQADLRDLLEPEAIRQVVAQLQHLSAERHARGPEDAADLLRILGPLDAAGGRERGVEAAWWTELRSPAPDHRTRVGGRDVWAAVEDAARLRDGLGAPLPLGIPAAHLVPVADPVGDAWSPMPGPMVRSPRRRRPPPWGCRHGGGHPAGSRTCGPVVCSWAGSCPTPRASSGAIRTCCRLIKRRSVALLRHQIEPVEPSVLGMFLPRWQQIPADTGQRLRGAEGVLEVARILAGVPLSLASLESATLPLRVADYRPELLDELTTQGEVVWTGHGSLPGGDGWVVLAPAGLEALLPTVEDPMLSERSREILDVLRQGGGWSTRDLERRLRDPRRFVVRGPTGRLGSLGDRGPRRAPVGRAGQQRHAGARATSPKRRSLPPAPDVRPASLSVPRGSSPARPLRRSHGSSLGRRSVGSGRLGPDRGVGRVDGCPGRWFALPEPEISAEALALLRAEAHLDRWGLVTRGAVAASGDAGGFAGAYRTLRAMEDRGRVQRVYAVEGLGAAQFALPGVVDQLRALDSSRPDASRVASADGSTPGGGSSEGSVLVLPAADPANAYGAALEWPASDWTGIGGSPHRPGRSSGSHVVLVAGRPILYVERGGHSLLTFGVVSGADGARASPPGRGTESGEPAPLAGVLQAGRHRLDGRRA